MIMPKPFFLLLLLLARRIHTLRVGGLFAQFSKNSDGKYVVDQAGVRQMAAVQLAIDQVNNKKDGVYDDLLPNTQLELLIEDTKIQHKYALNGAYNLVQHDCVGFIGGWASGPTIEISELLLIPSVDRAIVGTSQTSPQLSESRFSNFLRTLPSDDVAAKRTAGLMKGHFEWGCANILIGSGDPYSTAGIKAFETAAIDNGIDVCTKAVYETGSTDMHAPIKEIMENSCCRVTVLFGQTQDLASLLLEAHNQNYAGEWIMGDSIIAGLDDVVKNLKHHLDESSIHKLLRGIFTLTVKQVKSEKFLDFERAWYSQPSSATMSQDGSRTNCSDAVDATGRYIWREDGEKEGRCSGIDFEQAGQNWRANETSENDIVCQSAAISTYVPYGYDAGIAMAHGLHELIHRRGIDASEITADLLFQAIQNSTFHGVSGHVSFLSNGDRRSDHFEYAVYNYHEATRGFEAVGRMVNGSFAAECEGGSCARMVFSDGKSNVPVVRVVCVAGVFSQFSRDSSGTTVVDPGGLRLMPAVQMAIDRVNDKNDGIYDDLLPNVQLQMLVRDTKMQESRAVEQAADLAEYDCVGYIGAWASSPTIALSRFLAKSSIDRAMISPSAASPQLSEPEFSNFLRTGLSEGQSAKLMATLMIDHFNWTCANLLIGAGDAYSTDVAEAFEKAAIDSGIDVCTKATYKAGSVEMEKPIKEIMDNSCCLVTVLFGQTQDISSLLLEAHRQKYPGEWIMSGNVIATLGGIITDLKNHMTESSVHKLLRGIFSLGPISLAKRDDPITEFEEFQDAWYSQPSSAIMSQDGSRTKCSDAVDATGRYIWREDGEKEGRCSGIDFEQAGQKWRDNGCDNADPVCLSAAISTYVPYAYDAGIAMAIGLDKLLNRQGISPSKITANLLVNAIRNSSFKGSSGAVSFTDKGDRNEDAFKFAVYNYHSDGTVHGFRPVGKMLNEKFVSECEGGPCAPMMFSNGKSSVPVVRVVLVGGLFAQFGKDGEEYVVNETGVRQMAAVQMAINAINDKEDGLFDDLLPRTKIELLIGDTKSEEQAAMAEAFRYNKRDSVAIIGPASLEPTLDVSSWLSIPSIDRALIGYSVTSPKLRDAANFLRTPLSDDFPETVLAKLIKGHFKWTCVNVLHTEDNAEAFQKAAKNEGIDVCPVPYAADSAHISKTFNRLTTSNCGCSVCRCRVNVAFGPPAALISLFVEADRQEYEGEWLVGDSEFGSFDDVVQNLTNSLGEDSAHKILRGTITIGAQKFDHDKFREFQRAWYSQPSSVIMSRDGSRIEDTCSDVFDFLGRYIWREDGNKQGRCCGIDFKQAGEKWRANQCSNADPVCSSAAISTYVPFAYDAGIALAHGLDKLIHRESIVRDDITADMLIQAIRSSSFEGVSGNVSFLENGDRRPDRFSYVVYNYMYNSTAHGLQVVGKMLNGRFHRECAGGPCVSTMYSDGSTQRPDSRLPPVATTEKLQVALQKVDQTFVTILTDAVITLVALILAIILGSLIYYRCRRHRQKLEKEKKNNLLISRLQKNWSKLLEGEGVDGLSHMPEKWQSGIVPVRSKTGAALSAHLQSVANKIVKHRRCCERRSHLLAVKTELKDYAQEHVEPFFVQRNAMYMSCLLKNHDREDMPPPNMQPGVSSRINIDRYGSRHDGSLPWPKNSSPLCRQIMFLLRDLDNMFKKGYNQRWDLCIMEEDRTAYTHWMTHSLHEILSPGKVLRQNTSDVFDLFHQAAQAHSYYNKVCKRIAKQTNAEWHPGPLKKMFRILEKAEHVRVGDDDRLSFDCSKICDIVRGTLIYDTLGDQQGGVLCGIRALFDCPELKIIRVKDRFSNPTTAGWRDVLLNARMVLDNGLVLPHIVEVQLHQRDLREERMNVGGHYIYERHRALFEACEMVYGDEASRKLKDIETKKIIPNNTHRKNGNPSAPTLDKSRRGNSILRSHSMISPITSLISFKRNVLNQIKTREESFDNIHSKSAQSLTAINPPALKVPKKTLSYAASADDLMRMKTKNPSHSCPDRTPNIIKEREASRIKQYLPKMDQENADSSKRSSPEIDKIGLRKNAASSFDTTSPKLDQQSAGEHEEGGSKGSIPEIDEKSIGGHAAAIFNVDESKSLQVSVVVHSDPEQNPDSQKLKPTKIVPRKGAIFL